MVKHKRSHKKNYDFFVSPRNTPHLREKTIIIGLAYFFAGLNCIVYGLMCAEDGGAYDIFIGVVLILRAGIGITDSLRENRGTFAAIGTCVLHLVFSGVIAISSTSWWMAVYAGEVFVIAIAVYISFKHPKRHLPFEK